MLTRSLFSCSSLVGTTSAPALRPAVFLIRRDKVGGSIVLAAHSFNAYATCCFPVGVCTALRRVSWEYAFDGPELLR